MPIIICKALPASQSRVFVIAVDGSENSRNGFDIAMALVNSKDKLYCVTVKANEQKEEQNKVEGDEHNLNMSAADICDYYTSELQSYGPADCEFVSLSCPTNQTVAECLVQYSDGVHADFFAISPRARPIFTSVTEHIITAVKANVILCKH